MGLIEHRQLIILGAGPAGLSRNAHPEDAEGTDDASAHHEERLAHPPRRGRPGAGRDHTRPEAAQAPRVGAGLARRAGGARDSARTRDPACTRDPARTRDPGGARRARTATPRQLWSPGGPLHGAGHGLSLIHISEPTRPY